MLYAHLVLLNPAAKKFSDFHKIQYCTILFPSCPRWNPQAQITSQSLHHLSVKVVFLTSKAWITIQYYCTILFPSCPRWMQYAILQDPKSSKIHNIANHITIIDMCTILSTTLCIICDDALDEFLFCCVGAGWCFGFVAISNAHNSTFSSYLQ